MLRLIMFLLLSGLALTGHGALAAPLQADEGRRILSGEEVSVLRDPEARFTIDDVAAPALLEQFHALGRNESFGYTKDVIWLRIHLQRDQIASPDWRLEVSFPYFNDLRLYAPTPEGFVARQAGDRFPFAERELRYRNPLFVVNLPDDRPRDFYLRIQTDSSASVALMLWQPASFREAGQLELLWLGAVFGMLLMSLLFSLFNWLVTRDTRLLWFAGWSAALLVMVPTHLGLVTQFLLPRTPLLADLLVPWTLAITFATAVMTMRGPLESRQSFPRLDLLIRFCALAILIAPLTREVDLYRLIGGPLIQWLSIVGLSVNGWVAWHLWWRRKVAGAGYLFAAHVGIIFSTIIGRLAVLGLLPASIWNTYSWVIGVMAFLLLSLIGVVIEVRASSEARLQAERAALRSADLARQEQQLREEQTLFFSFVAHELRSPLGVIVAGLKNLGREFAAAGTATQSRLQRLSRAAERMGTMVERHLQLQRLANADFAPRLIAVPPQEPAAEALLVARETYPQRVFEWSAATDLPPAVRLDAELIVLALTNLLTNAAKYSPEGMPVRLELAADTQLHYRVMDQGPGIAPEECERLFRIYQRAADTAQSGNQAGFGIGLATAQRIARIHGGSLTYADGNQGGAIFTLSIPLAIQSATVTA